MTEVLNVAETKRRFSELIERVGRGERFVVARRGKPVLALVPAHEAELQEEQHRVGILGLLGLAADIEGFDEVMEEVVRSRQKARDRPAPKFD